MKYFRKNIERMQGYVPGIQPRGEGWLKLNTNENPFPPSPDVIEALSRALDGSLSLYPDPAADELRVTIARICRVKPDMVIAGNGSDEILSIITRSFLSAGKRALILHPTYSLFETLITIQGAGIIRQKLDPDFNIQDELFTKKADCAFIANPNPQAGTLFSREQMARLARTIGGILVIDEAYVDFAPRNCLPLVKKYGNVIVTRSLSKSYSLAGLRVGFAIAQPSIVEGMMKVKDSYNLNRLSQVAAVAALKDRERFKKNVGEIIRQRKFLSGALKTLGFRVMPSAANFLLATPPNGITAAQLYRELLERKVLIRYFDTKELRDYVRITVGSGGQNNDLLKAIKLSFIRFKVNYPETPFGVVKF